MSFKTRNPKPDESKVEAFVNRAEDLSDSVEQEKEKTLADILKDLDPEAPRKLTTYTLPMNKYEYTLLKALAKHENRPVANVLRHAILELAKKNDLI